MTVGERPGVCMHVFLFPTPLIYMLVRGQPFLEFCQLSTHMDSRIGFPMGRFRHECLSFLQHVRTLVELNWFPFGAIQHTLISDITVDTVIFLHDR
jgi:hypothetical protein